MSSPKYDVIVPGKNGNVTIHRSLGYYEGITFIKWMNCEWNVKKVKGTEYYTLWDNAWQYAAQVVREGRYLSKGIHIY